MGRRRSTVVPEGQDFLAALFLVVEPDEDFFAVDFVAGDFLAVDFFAGDFFADEEDEEELLDFFAGDDDEELDRLEEEVFLAAVDFALEVFFAAEDFAVLAFLAVEDFAAPAFFAGDELLAALLVFFAAELEVFFALPPPVARFAAAAVRCTAGFATDGVAFSTAAIVSLGNFLAPDTTSLSWAPGLKLGTAFFFDFIRAPVAGLRTQRASRTRFSKEPKPVMATFSPLATSRVIVSSTVSSA